MFISLWFTKMAWFEFIICLPLFGFLSQKKVQLTFYDIDLSLQFPVFIELSVFEPKMKPKLSVREGSWQWGVPWYVYFCHQIDRYMPGGGYYPHIWARQCLVPRPHYCARPARFESRGPSEPIVSDTSPKSIDREGLRRRRTGTRQG